MNWMAKVWILAALLLVLASGVALAADLKGEVASCFPAAPPGFQSEEGVYFDTELGGNLLAYLQRGDEVSQEYIGGQTIAIHLLGRGIGAFINAANGRLPGCDAVKVAGRKASVFYDSALVVIVADKAAV